MGMAAEDPALGMYPPYLRRTVSRLRDAASALRDGSPELTAVVLNDETRFLVPTMWLALSCTVWYSMLSHQMTETVAAEVHFEDMSATQFLVLMTFLLPECAPRDGEEKTLMRDYCTDIAALAGKYGINWLRDEALKTLAKLPVTARRLLHWKRYADADTYSHAPQKAMRNIDQVDLGELQEKSGDVIVELVTAWQATVREKVEKAETVRAKLLSAEETMVSALQETFGKNYKPEVLRVLMGEMREAVRTACHNVSAKDD